MLKTQAVMLRSYAMLPVMTWAIFDSADHRLLGFSESEPECSEGKIKTN